MNNNKANKLGMNNICQRKEARYLTVSEEKRFLEETEGTANYRQCRFILETGLRCSEMIGLKWE